MAEAAVAAATEVISAAIVAVVAVEVAAAAVAVEAAIMTMTVEVEEVAGAEAPATMVGMETIWVEEAAAGDLAVGTTTRSSSPPLTSATLLVAAVAIEAATIAGIQAWNPVHRRLERTAVAAVETEAVGADSEIAVDEVAVASAEATTTRRCTASRLGEGHLSSRSRGEMAARFTLEI